MKSKDKNICDWGRKRINKFSKVKEEWIRRFGIGRNIPLPSPPPPADRGVQPAARSTRRRRRRRTRRAPSTCLGAVACARRSWLSWKASASNTSALRCRLRIGFFMVAGRAPTTLHIQWDTRSYEGALGRAALVIESAIVEFENSFSSNTPQKLSLWKN